MRRLAVRLLVITALMLSNSGFADDTIKIYGIISYLANDLSELRIDDLIIPLTKAEIKGFLSLGALVEIEGYWQKDLLIAKEVEVKRLTQPDIFIYRGQVTNGKVLGLSFPDLSEGAWLELTTKRSKKGNLEILLVKPLQNFDSALQAVVEAISENGFIAGGVSVVSSQQVSLGDQVSIKGTWQEGQLVESE